MKRKEPVNPAGEDLEITSNSNEEKESDSGSKSKLGRRGFLKIGAGAAAITLTNPLDAIAQRRATTRLAARASGECNDVPFLEPTKVVSEIIDGKSVLNYDLVAEKLAWSYVCNGQTVLGLQPVFNGALPGPSLYVDPGTTLNLTLKNNLDEMPPFANDNCADGHHQDPTKPACFQHTNMHFHGFQVSPCSLDNTGKTHCGPYALNGTNPPLKSSSDDVLVDVFPGQTNQYQVVLPDMHAPGTNWYHSHVHGASAYQVSGGMAGAIIIREPTEEARIVRQDLDKVFMLQEILVNPPPPAPWPVYPPIYGSQPGGGGTQVKTEFFVNGQCRPTLRMKQGQMMRWRFVNTAVTPGGLMKLKVVKTQTCTSTFPNPVPQGEVMHLIAMDGLSFYGINPQPVRYHLLALGGRADFLMKFDEPGLYMLLKDSYPLESVKKPDSTTATLATANTQKVLMYIDVEPSTEYKDEIPKVIPGKKPDYLQPIWSVSTPPDRVRQQPINFQNTGAGLFQIDGAPYDANKPIEVQLNTAEEWTLVNSAGLVPQSNTHPFHVHLNPFQILGVSFDFEVTDADLQQFGYKRMDSTDPCTWPFWDTVALPGAARPQKGTPPPTTQLKIRSRFLIYDGEYVTHCHILVHEDVGMMINVKLIGDGIGPSEAVHDYPPAARACIDRTSKCP